jgi:hypothetical protein
MLKPPTRWEKFKWLLARRGLWSVPKPIDLTNRLRPLADPTMFAPANSAETMTAIIPRLNRGWRVAMTEDRSRVWLEFARQPGKDSPRIDAGASDGVREVRPNPDAK